MNMIIMLSLCFALIQQYKSAAYHKMPHFAREKYNESFRSVLFTRNIQSGVYDVGIFRHFDSLPKLNSIVFNRSMCLRLKQSAEK